MEQGKPLITGKLIIEKRQTGERWPQMTCRGWSHMSASQGTSKIAIRPPEASKRKGGTLLHTFRRSKALPPPRVHTARLRNERQGISVVGSHPVCGTLV